MAILKFLKNYNNYYNRIVKHDTLVSEFNNYPNAGITNINFNPNDGLYTEQIVNWSNSWTPDYMLVLNSYKTEQLSIMESGFELFQIGVYGDFDSRYSSDDIDDLISEGFYNSESKTLDLTNIGLYDNEGYNPIYLTIEGEWTLDQFSLKVNVPNGLNFLIWSDNNTKQFGVTGEKIINKEYLQSIGWLDNENVWGIRIYGASPDVFYGSAICKDYLTEEDIDSRWFVLEWKRTRKGQYQAILKADVIADNFNTVLNAPTYIKKGKIRDINDPLLFNSEGMAFNQIKQSETPLKDETKSGWVVGYIPSDWAGDTIQSNVVITSANADITVNGLSNWSYWKNVTSNSSFKYMTSSSGNNKVGLKVKWAHTEVGYSDSYIDFYGQTLWFNTSSGYESTTTNDWGGQDASNTNWPSWASNYHIKAANTLGWYSKTELTSSERNALINQFTNDTFKGYVNTVIGQDTEVQSQATVNQLLNLRSKIIKDSSTNTYYRIDIITINEASPITPNVSTTAGYNVISYVRNGVSNASGWSADGTITTGDVVVQLASDAYALNLTQISVDCETTIDTDRYHLSDNPYDMFCIPYSDTLQIYDGTRTFTCVKDVALNIAEHIAKEAGSGTVYDVQLLPYCPARHVIAGSTNPGTTLDVSKSKYDHIVTVSGGAITGYINTIIWCMSSSFTFDIAHTINVPQYPVNIKLSNECDMYRLSSGNFNGIFEFSPAKSKGITGFKVECTYKPFNPYIHVTPKLKGLYGENYSIIDDMRGLICGGDYSLPQLSNAWANYELSNKNYQQIFDRTIQNLDVQYDVAAQQALWGAISGTVTGSATGGVSGAITGGKIGGGYGAIAGAAVGATVGGVASGIAGAVDYQNVKKLQEENRNFQTDLYNYNLQNIKAIPSSLTKSSALTFNTRVWPFLEYYTCTGDEKQAFMDKLTYNGMTIMKISKISNYYLEGDRAFVQGDIIRLENIDGESGVAAEIQSEISKGVFI